MKLVVVLNIFKTQLFLTLLLSNIETLLFKTVFLWSGILPVYRTIRIVIL